MPEMQDKSFQCYKGGWIMPKNFRKIPAHVRAGLGRIGQQPVVAGCGMVFAERDLRAGHLRHLGIKFQRGQLVVPEQVIPLPSRGKYCERNFYGVEIIRKDLPTETHYNYVETPNWGDSSYGTHTVALPYEKYPRDHVAPRLSSIGMECQPAPGQNRKYFITFQVSEVLDPTSDEFDDRLLECINLLQENVGRCGVQRAHATLTDYIGTLNVAWELFPPGTRDEVMVRIFRGRNPTPTERQLIDDRYRFFMGLQPQQLVYGTSGLQRYFGAMLAPDLVIFENLKYGNAIYVMFEDWEQLSQRSRIELLSGRFGDNFERVVHTQGWKDRVQAIVRSRLEED
jgi:hypothetical protein